MALYDPNELGRVGDADRALAVPATPLRVDGPTGFDPSRMDFSLEEILAWARTKPADEEYDYDDNRDCALCQFLRGTGRAIDPNLGTRDWNDLGSDGWSNHLLPEGANYAAGASPRTFGAFADRLEQALAQ